ncbi:MAG: acyltransferase [Opitutales bacterium]|nr:acyltransferase [Opitutales bacterium]
MTTQTQTHAPCVSPDEKRHLVWIDCARWIAMFLVVVCHACDPFNCSAESASNPDFLRWGAIWGSVLRPCVPLFVMITGALLLPVRENTLGEFYKKRIPRVLIPFLIWSAIYTLFPWFASLATATPEAAKQLVLTFFPYASFMNGGNGPETTLSAALGTLATVPLSFNYFSVHLWYVYMLLGLYLYLPVFSAWVEKVSTKTKWAFLAVWGVTLVLPYADVFLTPHLPFGAGYLFGTCSWNAFGTFYAFAGFNGYLLLGHVLAETARERSVKKTLAVALPMLLAGTLLTFVGFLWVRLMGSLDNPQVFNALADGGFLSRCLADVAQSLAGTTPEAVSATAKTFQAEPMVELFWTYCSLNVVLSSAALFLLISKIEISTGRFTNFLATLGKLGFGVYLVHYFFVGPSYVLAVKIGVPLELQIPVSAFFAFVVTYVVVRVLYAILPKPKIFLG